MSKNKLTSVKRRNKSFPLKVDKTAETSPEYDQCASNAAIESSLNTPTLSIDNIHITEENTAQDISSTNK